jgi:alanine racemase
LRAKIACPSGGGNNNLVMPGLVPGIHAFADRQRSKDVDGRDKPGHDELNVATISPPFVKFRAMSDSLPTEATGLLTVDLSALTANWKTLAKRAAGASCAAVVKADAYGVGLEQAAQALTKAGCDTFFVATFDEALRLRTILPAVTIYLLNGLNPGSAELVCGIDVRPVLGSMDEIAEWSAYAKETGEEALAAIHIDTGMNRHGLTLAEAEAIAPKLATSEYSFKPSLVMSHLACADEPEHALNKQQIEAFSAIAKKFPGIPASLCNSAGLLAFPEAHFDLVRPGVSLYGGRALNDGENPMQPVVKVQARIVTLRDAKAGTTVGYGARLKLSRDSKLAIVSAGYADGMFRAAGSSDNKKGAEAIVAGQRCNIAGRISMDLMAIDVTGVPAGKVKRGDLVTLLGDGITVDDLAGHARTIGYEVLTSLGRRWKRIYSE